MRLLCRLWRSIYGRDLYLLANADLVTATFRTTGATSIWGGWVRAQTEPCRLQSLQRFEYGTNSTNAWAAHCWGAPSPSTCPAGSREVDACKNVCVHMGISQSECILLPGCAHGHLTMPRAVLLEGVQTLWLQWPGQPMLNELSSQLNRVLMLRRPWSTYMYSVFCCLLRNAD